MTVKFTIETEDSHQVGPNNFISIGLKWPNFISNELLAPAGTIASANPDRSLPTFHLSIYFLSSIYLY